jgi:hypothetical protein
MVLTVGSMRGTAGRRPKRFIRILGSIPWRNAWVRGRS